MKRLKYIFGALLLVFVIGCGNKEQVVDKPNLLFIWADQQKAATMSVYGNTEYDVPNLDKLADESIVFKNAYVAQPVCTPSRSTILTGQYPHTTGCTANNVALDELAICLPEMFEPGEYTSGYYGKWHLGNEIFNQQGFDEWVSIEDVYTEHYDSSKDKNARSTYHQFLIENGFSPDDTLNNIFTRNHATTLPYHYSKTKFLALRAADFLERNKENSFILYVSFLEPHSPFSGPFNDCYDKDSLSFPENLTHKFDDDEPARLKLLQKGYKKPLANIHKTNANYAGLVKQVDLSLGIIMDKLKQLGLDKNTIVVYTSDHGEMMGAHGLINKGVMYEDAVRIPLMIRNPFMENHGVKVYEERVSQVDLMPTVLEMMNRNLEEQTQLQGKSLFTDLKQGVVKEKPVFVEWNPNYLQPIKDRLKVGKDCKYSNEELAQIGGQYIRTVVTPDGWKLNWSDVDKSQLFDLNNDPNELNNLIYDKKYEKKIQEMKRHILSWQKEVNDKVKFD